MMHTSDKIIIFITDTQNKIYSFSFVILLKYLYNMIITWEQIIYQE